MATPVKIDLAEQEAKIKQLVDQGQREEAGKELFTLIVSCVQSGDINNACRLREFFSTVNPMAIQEVIKVNEIVDQALRETVDDTFSNIWAGLREALNEEEFLALYHALQTKTAEPDKLILRIGSKLDGLLFLTEGTISVVCFCGEKNYQVKLMEPGSMIGESCFRASVWTVSLVTKTPVTMSILPYEQLTNLVNRFPGFEARLFNFASQFDDLPAVLKEKHLDRRRFERFTVEFKIQFQEIDKDGKAAGPLSKGLLDNISQGGVSFLLRIGSRDKRRLFFDRRLLISVQMEEGKIQFTGTVRAVTSHSLRDHDYAIHIAFDKEIPREKIDLLLNEEKNRVAQDQLIPQEDLTELILESEKAASAESASPEQIDQIPSELVFQEQVDQIPPEPVPQEQVDKISPHQEINIAAEQTVDQEKSVHISQKKEVTGGELQRGEFSTNLEKKDLPSADQPDIDNSQLSKYFHAAIKHNASDIHVIPGEPIIFRRIGRLVKIKGPTLTEDQWQSLVFEVLSPKQQKTLQENKQLDFVIELKGFGRFRGSAMQHRLGFSAIFRYIPLKIPSFQDLGLPEIIKKVLDNHQGLILVTGGTGQGKSTTLAAMVNYINSSRADHVLTVEDPIEFIHPLLQGVVNQRQLGDDTLSYGNALRGALRQDPDVIMIGELRDLDTISLAISAAETGHLVLGTMATSSAPKTVDRVIDSFPATEQNQIRAMLSESLKAVITQRLIPKVDGQGRVLALEVLIGSLPVSYIIREGKVYQLPSLMQMNKNIGMQIMDDSIANLLKEGIISEEAARANANDPKRFRSVQK